MTSETVRRGRKPNSVTVRTAATKFAQTAIEALASVANDQSAPHQARVDAASEILRTATAPRPKNG